MISAVLDTNTIVSGTIVPQGISAQLVAGARARRFTLVTSAPLIAEVARALRRPRIRRKYQISEGQAHRVEHLLAHETVPTPLTEQVQGVATHPEDDLILATAVSAHADYLVTGDRQLQRLGTYQGVTILSPRAFLDVLRAQQA